MRCECVCASGRCQSHHNLRKESQGAPKCIFSCFWSIDSAGAALSPSELNSALYSYKTTPSTGASGSLSHWWKSGTSRFQTQHQKSAVLGIMIMKHYETSGTENGFILSCKWFWFSFSLTFKNKFRMKLFAQMTFSLQFPSSCYLAQKPKGKPACVGIYKLV